MTALLLCEVAAKVLVLAASLILLGPHLQIPAGLPGKDNPFILRKVDESAPCHFAVEYRRIKDRKSDPRVAFIDLNALVSSSKSDFTQSCKVITQQTEDSVTVFDQANGYLAVFFGMPEVSTTVTYFSVKNQATGITLYVDRTDKNAWTTHVFRYLQGKWQDESEQYLAPLKLAESDYFVAPEYGRTGRILTRKNGDFVHKEWVSWDGSRFVVVASAPGWKCPALLRYWAADQRQQFCTAIK